jgi:hypothetical protein
MSPSFDGRYAMTRIGLSMHLCAMRAAVVLPAPVPTILARAVKEYGPLLPPRRRLCIGLGPLTVISPHPKHRASLCADSIAPP